LQTYDGRNGPLEASDDGTALSVFNDGGVVSSGTPAPRFTLVVAVQAGTPPPSVESAREVLARRIDGGVLLGGGGSVLGQNCTG
jgi:hypothetical protein